VLFSGFKHNTVTCGERGPSFPRGHEEREIPRDDLATTPTVRAGEGMEACAGRVGTLSDGVPSIFVAQPAM